VVRLVRASISSSGTGPVWVQPIPSTVVGVVLVLVAVSLR
jgi:hypothetical protein